MARTNNPGLTAAEAAKAFWDDEQLRIAQAIRVRSGRNADITQVGVVRRGLTAGPPVPGTRRGTTQARRAVAGESVRALPTKQARAVKSKVRKAKKATARFFTTVGVLAVVFMFAMAAVATWSQHAG